MIQNKYFKFYNSLPRKIQNGIYLTLILFFLSSILEVLTIVSIEPLVSTLLNLSNIENITDVINLKILSFSFNFSLPKLILTSLFLSTLSIVCRLISLRNSGKYSQMIGSYLSNRILTSVLINVDDNSNLNNQGSDSITALTSTQIDYSVTSISSQLQFIYNFSNTLILGLGIVFIKPILSLILISILGIFFIISAILIRPTMIKNGLDISKRTLISNHEALNLYQIRDQLRINKNFTYDTFKFNLNNFKQRMSIYKSNFISLIPRSLIDYCIFLVIPIMVYLSIYSRRYSFNFSIILPSLITIGVAMQRLLPSLNQLFRLWSRIKGYDPSLFKILKIVDNCQEINNYSYHLKTFKKKFNKKVIIDEIKINNLSYITNEKKCILRNINYTLRKNDSICLSGESGSGKTTFVRLISGLLKSTSGEIYVNNQNINKFYSFNHSSNLSLDIAYIPQSGSLFSGSILENLTLFSEKKTKYEEINKILEITLCDEFIKKLPNGINEVLNDRSSIKLSGGQIQRLSIARALYQNSSMIVLDESTNALDIKKEEILIKNLVNYYDGIFIMISHRKNIGHLFKKNIFIQNKSLKSLNN